MDKLAKIKSIRNKLINNIPSVGSWLQIPHPTIAEIFGKNNYDWIGVDLEHGSISINDLPDIFRAIELGGTLPLVRLSRDNHELGKKVLDAGAAGVIVPMVTSEKDIKDLIESLSWPPNGTRGVGYSRANLFGREFDNYNELEDILKNTSINSEIVMVPAFTGLGAPHWQPNSRATISGLTRDSNKNEIIASSVQSISLQTYDLMNAINEDTKKLFENPLNSIRVDGGMTENDWFMQNLSDICDIKISKSNEQEATALGAASLSALGSQEINDLKEFNVNLYKNKEFLPQMENQTREEIIKNWNKAINKIINV